MALVKKLLFFHLLFLGDAMYMKYFPCETNKNITEVDCSYKPISTVPVITDMSVKKLDLSYTKIKHMKPYAFANVHNLLHLTMNDNCSPDKLKTSKDSYCTMEINKYAFKGLNMLKSLSLQGNSLISIPWLPESLTYLNLEMNCLLNIVDTLPTPHLQQLHLGKNCFYANPCHQSLHIRESFFSNLPKLKILKLGYNNLTAVPKFLPPSLEHLDLEENTITEILEGAFFNLTVLKSLNLDWNCQRCDHKAMPCTPCPKNASLVLHKNSFYSKESAITKLTLKGNSLTTFPKGIFLPMKKLKWLDLSDNFLANAIQNETFFEELTGLEWISLIYNYERGYIFQEFTLSPYFCNMTKLQYLLLSGNFFLSLSNQSLDVLACFKKLKYLELRMNFMNSLNLTFLKHLPSILLIDFSDNKLNFLPKCLDLATQTNAQESSLSFPRIVREQASVDIWRSNQSNVPLHEDNQSPNSVNICDENDVPTPSLFIKVFCKKQVTFDLSQNNIVSLNKNVLLGMENAVCLDLSFNYINQALESGPFDDMKKLVFLNMSHNRLDMYHANAFSELNATLKLLDMSYNECYFKMKGMGQSLKFLEHLNQLEVLSLAGNGIGMRLEEHIICNSLKYLYFNGNRLDKMWQCWTTKYTSFFQKLTNLIYLDISDNNLKSISPKELVNFPRSIKLLSISDNLLNDFPWNSLSTLSSLCHLNLSKNNLFCLPPITLQIGVNFSLLDLSHNSFSSIPENFFSAANSLQHLYLDHNKIKQLDHRNLPAPFINGSATGILKLTLQDNPFECACDSSGLVDFLLNTSVEIPYLSTKVLCDGPDSQQGKSILLIDHRSCQDIYGRFSFLISFFLAVSFTVIPLLHHLYSWDIWYSLQLLWAGHKGYPKLSGSNSLHHYDAFVVFDTGNSAVRNWVYNELTVNLENLDQKRFCLCLEERDWLPGLSHIENLYNAVHHSLKTVFVLSKGVTVDGVIRQAFFMVQQRLLDEKVDTAVLVLLDEAFPKLKYLNLRRRLCRKSVLSWPRNPRAQPLFWNQMRVALSSDNLSLYDNKMSESFFQNL